MLQSTTYSFSLLQIIIFGHFCKHLSKQITCFFASNKTEVSSFYKECVDMIEYIFTVENWADALEKEAELLTQFKG